MFFMFSLFQILKIQMITKMTMLILLLMAISSNVAVGWATHNHPENTENYETSSKDKDTSEIIQNEDKFTIFTTDEDLCIKWVAVTTAEDIRA